MTGSSIVFLLYKLGDAAIRIVLQHLSRFSGGEQSAITIRQTASWHVFLQLVLDLPKDNEKKGIITWPGMTPTDAELQAEKLFEEEKIRARQKIRETFSCHNDVGSLY